MPRVQKLTLTLICVRLKSRSRSKFSQVLLHELKDMKEIRDLLTHSSLTLKSSKTFCLFTFTIRNKKLEELLPKIQMT